MRFIQYCKDNKIFLLTYLPHSTHSLQPLDVAIFGPLSLAYSNQLEGFLHDSLGRSSITKQDFFYLFWPAWEDAITPKNIISAWRSIRIQPWDPQVILQRFIDKDAERLLSSESSRSVLGADDWRRIKRLLKRVITDVYNEYMKKLSSTMHHLATQNILLNLRCNGLENTLENEKKKR